MLLRSGNDYMERLWAVECLGAEWELIQGVITYWQVSPFAFHLQFDLWGDILLVKETTSGDRTQGGR